MRFIFAACAVALSSSTLVIASVGCGTPPDGSTNSTSVAENGSYTGEALMKAVFFKIGPAAQKLRAPGEIQTTESAEETARADALLTRVRALDPEFFAHFAIDLQSGDPLKVEDALTKGAQLLANAQYEVPHLPSSTPVSPGRPGVAIGGSGIAIAQGTGLIDDHGVLLAESLDISQVAVAFGGGGAGGGGGVFEREKYVMKVADAFRAPHVE